jgi:hypothetical protein
MSTIMKIIQPEHINTDRWPKGPARWLPPTFSSYDQEESARWIVRFLTIRNSHERDQGWGSFQVSEITSFYKKQLAADGAPAGLVPQSFPFHGLATNGHLSIEKGVVTVMPSFVRAVAGQIR